MSNEAAARITRYLDARAKAKGLDPDCIAGMDVDCMLTVSDLRDVLTAIVAPAQQPTDWRAAVLDALASTGGDMPATATPAEIVRAVIDANVQIALDPRVSDAAPAQQPELLAALAKYRTAAAQSWAWIASAAGATVDRPATVTVPDAVGAAMLAWREVEHLLDSGYSSVGHEEFARLYYRACDSSNPDDWMAAALAAQRVINAERPAAPKCLRTSVACSWPDCGANCRHAAPKEQA